jgi:S-DNA-T family DNA segregation ATPase FtsK/SpoIIIE
MASNELIGLVAADFLKLRIKQDGNEGTARYLLDCLTAEQTAAIAKAVLNDSTLAPLVDIKLPASFVGDLGLPPEILTTERTTFFRSADCEKPARLLANVGDDEEQSLKEVVPIGAEQLLNHPETWVEVAAAGLHLTEDHKKWWTKALIGLLDVRSFPIDRFAEYVLQTQAAVQIEGHSIKAALGYALPGLFIPRDTAYFNAINDKTAGHASKWKALYAHAIKRRACYLLKQTPNQTLLTEDVLVEAFEKVRDSIPTTAHDVVETFVKAGSGWSPAADRLAQQEWEAVKPLFDGLQREKFNLGKATLEFYEEREEGLITAEERGYMVQLSDRKTTEALDEDEEFYRDHRLELKEEPALKAKWDRFIFGSPVEAGDFVVGIVMCLEHLFDQDFQNTQRKLHIQCDRRTKKDLREVNETVGIFFARRYRGLQTLFGKAVTWDVGELFKFDALAEAWHAGKKPFVNRSVSRGATSLKFYLELEVTLSNGNIDKFTKQFTWIFNPNAVSSEFTEDWDRLVKHPFVRCRVDRETSTSKGRYEPLDLRDSKGLRPSFDKDRGSLVSTYSKEDDIAVQFKANLKEAESRGSVTPETARKLEVLFLRFVEDYSAAIVAFVERGLASPKLLEQLRSLTQLLDLICLEAKGDRNRSWLLRPLLEIGTVQVHGGNTAAIVAPWQPMRMAALAVKARQVSALVRYLLTTEDVIFGDPRLLFRELQNELEHPFYPEVVLGWLGTHSEILSLSDYYLDYSLHEQPVAADEGEDDTNDNPTASSERVLDVVRRYLALYPHERSNLSVVLYNCDSARLPQAIVEKMGELQEDEQEMRCQVVLRHRDAQMLRFLYEKIIESADGDADSFVASEATKDFMARLRIGIMVDQAAPPDNCDGPPTDVVFLHDVIARHAQFEWFEESAKPVELLDLNPARWSRRRPAAEDDLKSVSYLCCPVQSPEGWSYLTALTTFFKGDWNGDTKERYLPARQLDFSDPETASIFKEVHDLGNWVVNYDELLDRRQLLNQNVQVIRYQQGATQGRSLLISSTAPLGLLKSMVLKRVQSLNLELNDDDCHALTKRLIDDANRISGDIVLRAAKRGRNASELIGVVLSRYLVKRELTGQRYFGWYFLDDYATWLGQKEQQIADVLALSPEVSQDGKLRLTAIISESKFIDYSSIAAKRKESQKQLRDTMKRIDQALFGDPHRLDRDLWLSRFSDLLLQGIEFSAGSRLDLAHWRRAIRDGECEIYLRGYSHIFVSGPSDSPECSDFTIVSDLDGSFQEVFSRGRLRQLIMAYWRNEDTTPIRKSASDQDVWAAPLFRPPSERITISLEVSEAAGNPSGNEGAKQAADTQKLNVAVPTPSPKPVAATQPTEVIKPQVPINDPSVASENSHWAYPSFQDLLEQHGRPTVDTEEEIKWLRLTENACKAALQQFQLNSKLQGSSLTPNAALLKFQGSANLTVEQVLRKRSEFLTTHRLNVISVRAEPGVISIAVARPERRVLQLADVWKGWHPSCVGGNHDLLVGIREENSAMLFLSPKRNAPHTLIAGSTGSGKSVLMQNLILGIAATNRPEEAQITVIDPKLGVDYFAFEGLPHLNGGIVDAQERAIEVLNGLVTEMDRRYSILRENRVPSVFDLNLKPNASQKLPILWVIHDEFAEWMMTEEYKDQVSNIVSRLGVKARAAGIYLIFAAQRPDVSVMPPQLRANLGNRLILRVDGEGTSEIALGEKGAERLLGKGHMAAKLEGEPDLVYAQVPFVDSAFLTSAVDLIKNAH